MLHNRIGTKFDVHQLHELESGIGLITSKTIHRIVENFIIPMPLEPGEAVKMGSYFPISPWRTLV